MTERHECHCGRRAERWRLEYVLSPHPAVCWYCDTCFDEAVERDAKADAAYLEGHELGYASGRPIYVEKCK